MSNKMKKKQVQNQAQDGRSMVEMLGVLAIIGVLSIGGISGYRMAMYRYQANQIANEINLMRTDAKMKVAQGAEKLMLGEPYDSGHLNFGSNYGVEFDFAVFSEAGEPEESGYYIKVSGVPAGVCKPLVTLLDNMDDAIAVVVNEQENNADSSADLCTEESNNALEVDFSTKDIGGASGNPEVTDPEQGDEPHECDPETCPGECNEEGVCECPEGSHLKGDECVSCWGGKVWDEGSNDCVCPAGAEKSGEDGEECACSTEKPHWNGTECTACPEGSTWDSTTGECKCEGNKVWKESVSGEDKCVEIVGECESNADCGPGEYCYMYYGYQCYDGQEFQSGKFGAGSGTCKSQCRNALKDAVIGEKTKFALAWPEGAERRTMNWWSAGRFCEALGRKQATLASIGCDGVAYNDHCQSETRKDLYDDFKNKTDSYVWMYDMYNNSSCYASYVSLASGLVNYTIRYSAHYALCE